MDNLNIDPGMLVVVGILVFFAVWSVVVGRRRANERARKLETMREDASARGWLFEGQRKPRGIFLNISGTTGGLSWRFETQSEPDTSSDTSDDYALWRSDSVSLPGDVVMLVPRLQNAVQFGALSVGGDNPLAQVAQRAFIKNVLHEDPGEMDEFSRVLAAETGSDPLRDSYIIMASSESAASKFLNRGAETALLQVAEGDNFAFDARIGAVLFWKKGLSVSFKTAVTDTIQIEEIARFGAALSWEN